MQLELALVPILAGYLFLTQTHLFKYAYKPKTQHRVFFEPAIAGGGLFLVASLLTQVLGELLDFWGTSASIEGLWQTMFPFDKADVLVMTVVLSIAIPPILNWRVSDEDAANRWALKNESARGRMLREAFENGKLVEVVLTHGQSFVGFVGRTPRYSDFEGDMALAPQLSGYRHEATHRLVVTTEYDDQGDDFRVVLMLDEVTFVSDFDPRSRYIDWDIPDVT